MVLNQNCLYMPFNIYHFRSDMKENRRKKEKIENSQPIEELFENNISKIMKNNPEKIVRKLLPIKTKNGFIEKHIIEDKILNEDNEIINNNNEREKKRKENDKGNNSDMEIEIDTHVRLKLKLQYLKDVYSCEI